MLSTAQIESMLNLQAGMNAKVNPQWLGAGYPFLRAAVIEGAEAMEHHGWKWWKAQQLDLPQLQMELVDIWHFALSDLIIAAQGDIPLAAHQLAQLLVEAEDKVVFDGETYLIEKLDTLEKIELLVGLAAARRFAVPLFAALLADCKLSWDDLYKQYVGKNVLNFFRQDHGYKQGTYLKLWQGREDNEHLVEVLAAVDPAAPNFRDQLYAGLAARYASAAG